MCKDMYSVFVLFYDKFFLYCYSYIALKISANSVYGFTGATVG